jgi:hypothetical protein
MPLDNSSLHQAILRQMIERGHAPSIDELALAFAQRREAVIEQLHALQAYHGVVLHPSTFEVWVIHPFSTAPTNFWVQAPTGSWWGNCAWCALGIAALVRTDVTITTTLGGESEQVRIPIAGGRVTNDRFVVHFPVPMRRAWDNVLFTCSTMLLFNNEAEVGDWCRRHRIARGDIRPIATVWEFAKAWYGRHLDADWRKWTAAEARGIFERFGLSGATWDIPAADERF